MSELTTIARPYAKAAFEFAVDKGTVESWNEMLFFAGEVAKNEQIAQFLSGSASAEKQSEIIISPTAYSLAFKAAGWHDGRYVYLASTSPNLIGLVTRVGRAQRRLNQKVSSFRNQLGVS